MYYYTANDKCSILFTVISVKCPKIIFSQTIITLFLRCNLSLVFNLTLNVQHFCRFILPRFYLLLKIKKIKQKLILQSTSTIYIWRRFSPNTFTYIYIKYILHCSEKSTENCQINH